MTDAQGLAALVTLILLPGALLVRAPWTSTPFLSLSFWLLTWWWLAPLGVSRRRFLAATLTVFALLLLLRLLRVLWRRPDPAGTLVVLMAALCLVPFFAQPVANTADGSRHGLAALLAVARDGLPSSYEPLLGLGPFGAHPPGLPLFAADLALLGGIPAARAAWLASLAARALLLIALFGLLARFVRPMVAASSAAVALLASPSESMALALAFGVAALTLLLGSEGRPGALAAGASLAGATLGHWVVAAAAVLALPAFRRGPALGIAIVTALCGAAPFLARAGPSLPAPPMRFAGDLLLTLLPVAGAAWLAERGRLPVRSVAWLGPAFVLLAIGGDLRSPSPLSPDDLEAMAWIAGRTPPLAPICSDAGPAAAWIPAVAGRALSEREPCPFRYHHIPQGIQPPGVVVFRNRTVAVTSFDSAEGNPLPPAAVP